MGDQAAYKLSSFSNVENNSSLSSTFKSNFNPTWRELEELEVQRRQLLQKAELPVWRIVLSWNGTCLRALCLDWLVWVPITIFVVVRILQRKHEMEDILEDSNIDILGGFLSFFLVLFVNQTNSRFFEMYKMAKECGGKITEVTGVVSTKFSPAATLRLVRYMNAAHVVGYVGLDGPYSKEHFFNHINEEYKLLTESEIEIIGRHGWNHDSFLELMTWCQQDVGKAQKEGDIDSFEARELNQLILGITRAMDGIYDYCEQPVHFFYIHFLCLLSALYLPLFALENALSVTSDNCSAEIVSGLIVVLQSVFVIGLRMLGQKMVDPFGDDLEDLSVISYVTGTLKDCRLILSSRKSPAINKSLENNMSRTVLPIS